MSYAESRSSIIVLVYGNVRGGHGGHNNNPTAKQFRVAYRKLVIHV